MKKEAEENREFKWIILGILIALAVQIIHELFITNMKVTFHLDDSGVVTLLFWEGIALLVIIFLYARYFVLKRN